MESKLVLLAAPLFLLFLYIEYYIAKKQRKDVFKYGSSISNISVGIAERFINLFVAGLFYNIFVWIYNNYAIFTIANKWYTAILCLLVADLVWYWYHRAGHQINLFWAAHIVHHHSDEFNFTAAARITTIQAFIRTPFWCILPLLGFHPNQVLVISVAHGVYSFFTHTQVIKAPKWLEYILITPSLHGVHHASNEKYLDKNFGDVFVFWDKIFGTFQKEEEKPVYGITHPLNRYSFLWQHFHYYMEILEAVKREDTWKKKIKIIFGGPELMDQNIRPEIEKIFFKNKIKQRIGENIKSYVNVQIIVALILLTFVTIKFSYLVGVEKTYCFAILLITLINIGALLEQRRWIYYLEISRLFFLALLVSYETNNWMAFLPIAGTLLVLVVSNTYKKWYFEQFLKY
jgi:sterol desaturase/sphingolipid hydroxylase (fatty acid hydroxylase superfamily)